MIPRLLAQRLQEATRRFPVVTLTGPRQSGKTTLVRNLFPKLPYVSLEAPDERTFALEDPRGFLSRFQGPVILDEVQRAPDLLSYIQVLVDEQPGATGRFILTGSQNFLLLSRLTQSLAGRTAVFHLLPFSLAELQRRPPLSLELLGRQPVSPGPPPSRDLLETLFTGFYPRIHDQGIPPREWLAGYYQTYLERDVRDLLQVGDLEAFSRFIRLCAGRCGQVLHLSGLASDCGISHTTARRWISVLEASFIVILLRPYYRHFGKRLIKSPKLYFTDTGLLCYLLQIRSPEELFHRAERGAIFETFVISEFYKNLLHQGESPTLYFWRDASGHEIDLLIDVGRRCIPVEAKSSQTLAPDAFKELFYWKRVVGGKNHQPLALVYGGDQSYTRSGAVVYPWFVL